MSSAAPDPATSSQERHRLTVAEGLLRSLDAPGGRALDTVVSFLDLPSTPTVEEAREMLEEIVEALGGKLDALRCSRCGSKLGKSSTCPKCGLSEVPTTPHAPPSGVFFEPGAPMEADSTADFPLATDVPKKKRRKKKKEDRMGKMQEARVTGVPPVPGSPKSQTGPEAAQNDPWGGPNAGAAQPGTVPYPGTIPPNLRESAGWENCGNCVFFNKMCNLYGLHRDGSGPDSVHRGGYPVDVDDLCDSHRTVTPPDQQRIHRAQRYVDRYLREGEQLAEAAASGDHDAATRARAKLDVAAAKLQEFEIDVDEAWSDAARAAAALARRAHSHGGGTDPIEATAHAIKKLKPHEQHNVARGVNVRHEGEMGYTTISHGRVITRHGTNAMEAARMAHQIADTHKMQKSLPTPLRRQRLLAAELGEARLLTEVKSDVYPGLDRSKKENWVDKAGGLPRYIERIAKHLHYEKGKEIGNAIAIAVNVVKKMCASGDTNFPGKQNVNAKSRAEACAAVAQWEAKKGKAKAKKVAESTWLEEAFDSALELYEEANRPIPPTWRSVERLLSEVAAIDGPDWYVGMAALDVSEGLLDEVGIEEAIEQELVEASIVHRLGIRFDPVKHPRQRGGRFREVLGKLERDAGGESAVSKLVKPKNVHGRAFDGRGTSHSVYKGGPNPRDYSDPIVFARDFTEWRKRAGIVGPSRPSGAGAGQRAASSATASAKKKTVEQHFADDAKLLAVTNYGLHQQATAGTGHHDLTVDMAIGGVLSTYPDVKDWHLEPQPDEGGKKVWHVHVERGDGTKHTIRVDETGDVSAVTGATPKPKLKAAPPPSPAKAGPSGYVATGDSNVVSHMQPGTVFKGDDKHMYKLHGDEWISGKKGPVKAAHIENLDTGTHKNVPYFAIHGKQYPIHAAAGSFTPKPASTPSSGDAVFADLLKSVQGQHGSLTSVHGKNVVVTGVIPGHTRTEVHAMISAAGGTPHSSVVNGTHVLVTGDKVGATKINAAKKKGVTVIPWSEFKQLVESLNDDRRAKLEDSRRRLVEATDPMEITRLRARVSTLEEKVYSAEERRQHATVGDDSYPIGDEEHAKQAMIRLNQGGLSNAEKAKVIAKAARYLGHGHSLVKKRKAELA